MQTTTATATPLHAQAVCLASARAWRAEAACLRQMAAGTAHLTDAQRATLLREADAADRQADWWLDGAAQHDTARE